MKRYILALCMLITTSMLSVNAKQLGVVSIGYSLHDLSLYEFIFPLDYITVSFSGEIQFSDNCEAAVMIGDEVVSSPREITISNWHNDNNTRKQGTVTLSDFSCVALPLGQTYTFHVAAGSVVDIEDPTSVNEEINLPLVVPANLNHYFDSETAELMISDESQKSFTGCRIWIRTEVDPIGSPIVYLKRNGETIGEYPAKISMQDWDLSSLVVNFPAVTLDEGAEYTLVLPANSCCSQYRADLTNDEITFMIQEASSAVCEVEQSSDDNAPIYDLMGRRVLNPTKGIYIKSGKKILINR